MTAPGRKSDAGKAKKEPAVVAVEAAALDVARKLAALPELGKAWPDGGWALIRGTTIRLFYEAAASAHGMTVARLERAMPEAAPVVAALAAHNLPALTPEQFGHVHETLVGYGLRGGEVVPTDGRRRRGAHFTPPELAARVTERTLDPLLKCMEGADVLRLRVCDPAVGAGAFLLAVVRDLAPRIPGVPIDVAKRLVAIHVVRGVDVDRFAVLASRLALTLECRADRMPADWLDHAIRHGDGLVGLGTTDQLLAFNYRPGAAPARPLARRDAALSEARDRLAEATQRRCSHLAEAARAYAVQG